MTFAFWILMLIVTATALVFHFMPRFSRPDILFGVTVSEAFVADAGRPLVSRYRTIVWIGAAAALALGLSGPHCAVRRSCGPADARGIGGIFWLSAGP